MRTTLHETAERLRILAYLQQAHWNRKLAASLLKMSYNCLLGKIRRYALADGPDRR
jgi:transcriptional regulator with GAF, ATPase, and Fis domain